MNKKGVEKVIEIVELRLDELQHIGFGYKECDPNGPKNASIRWGEFRLIQSGLDEIKKIIMDA